MLFKLHKFDSIKFESKYRGTLFATREGEGVGLSLPIGGPAQPSHDAELRHTGACAAGITVADIEQVATYLDANGDSAVYRVSKKIDISKLKVDVNELGRKLQGYNIYTQIVEADGNQVKINSRVFTPYSGINEDPVVRCCMKRS